MKKSLPLFLFISLFITVQSSGQQIGDLDTSFNSTGKVVTDINSSPDGGTSLVIQPDGRIITAGYTSVGTNYSYALTRHLPDGSLDTSFGGTGMVTTDFAPGYEFGSSVVLQPDGKIIVAGNKFSPPKYDHALIRYRSDGSLDAAFGVGGKVEHSIGQADGGINAIQLQPDGKIVACGIATSNNFGREFAITRYNSDGSIDPTFGMAGFVLFDFASSYDFAFALGIQADGKIVVGGSTGQDPVYDFGLVRLDSLGNVDSTFGTNGIVVTDFGRPDEWANALVIQPDGKILICGYSGSPYQIALARYDVNGILDVTFNGTGKVLTSASSDDAGNALALQSDGKIVVSGTARNGPNQDFSILRYTTDGILDTTFSIDGFLATDFGTNQDKSRGVAIQTDGKIVAAGSAGNDFALARYIVTLSTGIIDFASMNNSVLIYPNPVSNEARLEYTLAKPEHISIRLVDVNGRLVQTILENSYQTATDHTMVISFPETMEHGTYFIVMDNSSERFSIKIVK